MQSCPAHRPCAKVNDHGFKLGAPHHLGLPVRDTGSLIASDEQLPMEPSFPELYRAYAPLVRWSLRNVLSRTLYHAEGEDLTQEVFLRLIKHGPWLTTHADRVRWLTTVTRNIGISARRRRRMTTNCETIHELQW